MRLYYDMVCVNLKQKCLCCQYFLINSAYGWLNAMF